MKEYTPLKFRLFRFKHRSVISIGLLLAILLFFNPSNCISQEYFPFLTKINSPTLDYNENGTSSEPYSVTLEIVNNAKGEIVLDACIRIDSGYYITSAFAFEMKGRFKMKVGQSDKLMIYDLLSEIPPANSERFQWSNRAVKIIRNKTNYQQKIKVTTSEDFDVPVSISFVIEPRCTMEHLEFIVSNQSGKLTIKRGRSMNNNSRP